MVPDDRRRSLVDVPPREGDYVLYWMTAARRASHNFGLDRALEVAREAKRPLLVFEALRVGYRWASDRLHAFVLDGMRENLQAFERAGVRYLPYVEPEAGAGSGLLEALAERSVAVVTDDFPCFFLPKMLAATRSKLARLGVRLEAIDSNGLYPMRATERVFGRAVDFRRHLHKEILPHLERIPSSAPLERYSLGRAILPATVEARWPMADETLLAREPRALAALPIDHEVGVSPIDGGTSAARLGLEAFLSSRLDRYAGDRSHPDRDAASGLSPYLHFGHLSMHEVFARLVEREGWSAAQVNRKNVAKRAGFWGASEGFESFIDEALTWRELGYNYCANREDYADYESLPHWARETLEAHADDPRPWIYDLETLARSETHDDLWNAAQRELSTTGRMQNYLRMLWGKKILEWSPSPRRALEVMIELNNRYALDGRNPNSYSGIFWVLGRYDRAWGPERPIYGKIRYMTSDSAKRKLSLGDYLERFGEARQSRLL